MREAEMKRKKRLLMISAETGNFYCGTVLQNILKPLLHIHIGQVFETAGELPKRQGRLTYQRSKRSPQHLLPLPGRFECDLLLPGFDFGLQHIWLVRLSYVG